MPTIAFFHGIAIRMFFNDHAPPHCHACRGEQEAKFDITTGEMIGGKLPAVQRRLVQKWIAMYGYGASGRMGRRSQRPDA